MKVLHAQAQGDHQILLNVNLRTPEHRITVGPQEIIAEKAVESVAAGASVHRLGTFSQASLNIPNLSPRSRLQRLIFALQPAIVRKLRQQLTEIVDRSVNISAFRQRFR